MQGKHGPMQGNGARVALDIFAPSSLIICASYHASNRAEMTNNPTGRIPKPAGCVNTDPPVRLPCEDSVARQHIHAEQFRWPREELIPSADMLNIK